MLTLIRPLIHASLACFALAPALPASTIVVSASGGGAFTDIPAALAAAVNGDVVLVLPGTYSGFSLQKSVTILGVTGAEVTSPVSIANIPADQRAAVVNLSIRALEISACAGHVIVQDIQGTGGNPLQSVRIDGSSDVRLSNLRVFSNEEVGSFGGITATSSRVEVVRSVVYGRGQPEGYQGLAGGAALLARTGSRMHVVLSDLVGGNGANSHSGFGGNGAAGIHVKPGAEVILAGTSAVQVLGGASGWGDFSHEPFPCYLEGYPGPGAHVEPGAQLAHSGVVLMGGPSYASGTCNPYDGPPVLGSSTLVVPTDPTLELVGTPQAGTSVQIVLHAPAGSQARLKLGRNAVLVPDPTTQIEVLASTARNVNLGTVPLSGERTILWNLSASIARGTFMVLQAEITLPGGALVRTNSVPVVIR